MLNQSFSADNFRKIIDYENRKGVYLEGRFFPDVAKITEDIRKLNSEIREKKKQLGSAEFDEYKKIVNEKKEKLEGEKEEKLSVELQKVRDRIVNRDFKFELRKNESIGDKPVYTVEDKPEYYFASKQLQHNFRRLYKVKQASRYAIVSQIKALLDDNFPKYIIRTDIEDFYESIPHENLLRKLYGDNLLTFLSKRIIRIILADYRLKSASKKGVPRGVGLSAYLAELYMREIDSTIKALPDLIYYARYVDDIIMVFIPSSDGQKCTTDDIKEIIEKPPYCLSLNSAKTEEIDLTEKNSVGEVQYLGYKMIVRDGEVEVRLTDKKINKYKKRIDLTIASYLNFSKKNEKKARKLLIKRMRFLTGNTRLFNNKKNVLIGIYYSNSLLTNISDLADIDRYLEAQISNMVISPVLKHRLEKFRFSEGFNSKRYSPFTTGELSEIIDAWKHNR
jgi:hypothetical protein